MAGPAFVKVERPGGPRLATAPIKRGLNATSKGFAS